MKVLVIGPSPTKSKGGMATVIEEIAKDQKLNKQFDIDIYESYIDGNKLKVLLFSAISFIRFYFTKRNYDIYHIHAASYGSTFRKGLYVKTAKRWGKKVILHIHGAEYMKFFEGLSDRKKQKVNDILKEYFLSLNVKLVDFKLEFGRLKDGTILLADEISPDTCRFWDADTNEKLDKDRFRRDMGGVEDAYNEMMKRVFGN